MIRVAVFGANGKMGRTVCQTVADDPELQLAAAVDPGAVGQKVSGVTCVGSADEIPEAAADVAVDFTRPDQVMGTIRACVGSGIHCVVGTSGLSRDDLDEVRRLVDGARSNVFVAPNFSIGAVLSMLLARQAARYLGSCEVIELHHNEKLDAPSGTAIATAQGIAEVWNRLGRPPGGEPSPDERETLQGARGSTADGIRVHSVRLQGILAHQEILFGGLGQTLTIRHDSLDRSSFMPGVVLAVKKIGSRPGLTVGLEHLLDLDPS